MNQFIEKCKNWPTWAAVFGFGIGLFALFLSYGLYNYNQAYAFQSGVFFVLGIPTVVYHWTILILGRNWMKLEKGVALLGTGAVLLVLGAKAINLEIFAEGYIASVIGFAYAVLGMFMVWTAKD